MPSTRRSAAPAARGNDKLKRLQRENKELRKKLKAAELQCRQAIAAWAKSQITEKDVLRWEREFRKGVQGGSLTDLIQELEAKVR